MEDVVNHPSHYTRGGIECIDAMEASMPPWEFRGYLKGSVFKYLWRYEDKGLPDVDLGKCGFYLDRLSRHVKDHPPARHSEKGYSEMGGKENASNPKPMSKDLMTLGVYVGLLVLAYGIGKKAGFDKGVAAGSLEAYRTMMATW